MGANRNLNWDDLLDQLKNGQIPHDQIGSTIVKLGKPFVSARIIAAKDTVALYLDHSDSWVRHEADVVPDGMGQVERVSTCAHRCPSD